MELNDLRKEIDILDEKLIEIIALRFEKTREIGSIKKENTLNSVDNDRLNFILQSWKNNAIKNKLNPDLLEKIITLIHDEVIVEHNQKKKNCNKI